MPDSAGGLLHLCSLTGGDFPVPHTSLTEMGESGYLTDPKAAAVPELPDLDNTQSCCFHLNGISPALGLVRRESELLAGDVISLVWLQTGFWNFPWKAAS